MQMYINSEHKKADELMDAQKFDEALAAFNRALEENKEHPDLLSQRGVLYLHMNQKKNCIDDLEKALQLEEDNPYRYSSLAYAKDFFGDTDEAIQLYEKAVQLDPEDAIAYNNLGLLLEKKGYKKKAERTFEQADVLVMNQEDMKKQISGLQDNSLPKPNKNNPLPNKPKGEQLQPKKMESEPSESFRGVSKKLFTNKNTFKEYLSFIKNGFKLEK